MRKLPSFNFRMIFLKKRMLRVSILVLNLAAFMLLPVKAYCYDIQDDDKKTLEAFFNVLIDFEGIGYTLFSEKPMTSISFSRDPLKMPYEELINPQFDYLILKGWKTWNRYAHLFPSSTFF